MSLNLRIKETKNSRSDQIQQYNKIILIFLIIILTISMTHQAINDTAMIRGNITSSIDINPNQTFFAAVTRLRSENSSMFSYQLQLFNLTSLKQIALTHIYDTYSVQTHPCKILPNGNTIVVATKNHIIFYDNLLKIQHKVLHHQLDVKDLSCSPDSKLVNMVGTNTVLIWDTTTFKSINFPYDIQNSRSSRYSPDGNLLGVASTSAISVYDVKPISDTYDFILHPQYKVDGTLNSTSGFGFITSFDFNPTNNLQIVIGFYSASPRLYNFDGITNQYTKISTQDQPSFFENSKIVKFMPDGKRIFSSDNLQGVGLWPGSPNQPLLYKQNFLFYGPVPYNGGTKILGYNWQTIKVTEIQFQCKSGSNIYSTTCKCGNGQFWSLTAKSCQNCTQQTQDICTCDSNSHFDANLQRCVYDCQKIENAIATVTDSNDEGISCFCDRGYSWQNGKCTFNCSNIMFTNDSSNSSSTCQCFTGFTWNDKSKTCSCDQNSELVRENDKLHCSCLPYYQIDVQSNKCMPSCDIIPNSTGTDQDGNCTCDKGYKFEVTNNLWQITEINNQEGYKSNNITIMSSDIGGCIRNCTMYNFTQGYDGKDGCICRENMIWNSTTNKCILNCTKIQNAADLITYQNGTQACTCATLYSWVPQIIQCGRNCDNVKYVNSSKHSTTISCPCENKFNWDQVTNQCVINCSKVNYSQPWSIASPISCACRTIFVWDQPTISCMINCSQIWNAKERVSGGECACSQGQKFNATSLNCYTSSSLNQPWVWALLGVGGLFVFFVAIVLLKFCWNFATKKENTKKLKKNTQQKSRKMKQMPGQMNIPTTQRFAIEPT